MLIRLILSTVTLFLLNACGGALAGLDNTELATKRQDCMRQNPTSPGRVTACENIRKECERRRKSGNYVC
jgi:hypothetical protein